MKSLRSFVFLLTVMILLLALFWWSERKQGQQRSLSQPNVVSMQTDEPASTEESASNKPATTQQSDDTINDTAIAEQNESTPEKKELTYLEVYRMNRQFVACQAEIYHLIEDPNDDPIKVLHNKLNRLSGQKQVPLTPTQQQISSVNKHQESCSLLLETIRIMDLSPEITEQDNNDKAFNQTKEQLYNLLNETKPKTTKEQSIAAVLQLKTQWQTLFNEILAISEGSDQKNSDAIADLNRQAGQLKTTINQLVEELKLATDTESLQLELNEVSKQYDRIQDEIKGLYWVDTDARDQSIAHFNVINDQLFNRLSSLDPDVFYETQMTLEKNENIKYFGHAPYKDIGLYEAKMPFVEYVSPGDVVMQILDLHDDELFRLVIQYATQLYLCELGADCGPGSTWIKYYCFQSYNEIDARSCDLDLTSYLQNHRLSENHWQDVIWVLETLRGLYGQ